MRKTFYYSPTSAPVLLKVDYNITFGENITKAFNNEELPYCSNQTTHIRLNQTNYTYGWTSAGVYTAFHPVILSVTQLQLPFLALKLVHHNILNQSSPERDTFLWHGFYDLPTLSLSMHITMLPCIPSQDLFASVLQDINTLVMISALILVKGECIIIMRVLRSTSTFLWVDAHVGLFMDTSL